MKKIKFFVFDTNTLVSAFIIGSHTNAKAFDKARQTGKIITSDHISLELFSVFSQKKFDKYAPFDQRRTFFSLLETQMFLWPLPLPVITDCRDPKDNKFLELGVAAGASAIITGDKDLLVLHPFQNIPIISPGDFLQIF